MNIQEAAEEAFKAAENRAEYWAPESFNSEAHRQEYVQAAIDKFVECLAPSFDGEVDVENL